MRMQDYQLVNLLMLLIFTKSATEGINLVSSCLSENYFNDGDEVLLTSLEHHANLVPWHLVSKKIKNHFS